MSKLDTTKKVVNVIVGLGTTKIVRNIINNNTPKTEKRLERIELAAGSAVIGMMAADATQSYTDAKIDAIADWWKQNVTNSDK